MGLCSEHGIEKGPDADSVAGGAIITDIIALRGDGLHGFRCYRRSIKRVVKLLNRMKEHCLVTRTGTSACLAFTYK